MAECKFCGQGAGFMRSEHPDCRKSYEEGKEKVLELTRKTLFNTGDFDKLSKNVIHVADYSYIDAMEVQGLLIQGWEQAAGYLLSRGKLSAAAEERLLTFPKYFSLPALRKQNNATLMRVHQSRERREQEELEARQRREQEEQREMRRAGKELVNNIVRQQGLAPTVGNSLIEDINEVAEMYDLSPKVLGDAIVKGWREAVTDAYVYGDLTRETYDHLIQIANELAVPPPIIYASNELNAYRTKLQEKEQAELQARKRREQEALQAKQAELRKKREKGKRRVIALVRKLDAASINNNSLIREIKKVAEAYDLSRQVLGNALVEGWKKAVNDALANGILNRDVYNQLIQLAEELTIPHEFVEKSYVLKSVRKKLQEKEQEELLEKRRTGKELVIYLIRQHGASAIMDNGLTREIYEVAERYELNRELLDEAIIDGWEDVITDARQNVIVKHNEYDRLVQLAEELSIPHSIVDKSAELNAYRKKLLEIGKEHVIYLIRRQGGTPIIDNRLIRDINEVAEGYQLNQELLDESIIDGWEDAITDARHNGNVGQNEYYRLVQLAEALSIPHSIVAESYELNEYRKKYLFDILDKGMLPSGVNYAPGKEPFSLLNWDEVHNQRMIDQFDDYFHKYDDRRDLRMRNRNKKG